MMTVYLYLSDWVCAEAGFEEADVLIKDLLGDLMYVRLWVMIQEARLHTDLPEYMNHLSCQWFMHMLNLNNDLFNPSLFKVENKY